MMQIPSLDVRDAYLTILQCESMPRDFHDACEDDFEKCVPDQRDGALMWQKHFLAFLESRFSVHVCKACPSLISTDGCLHKVNSRLRVAPDSEDRRRKDTAYCRMGPSTAVSTCWKRFQIQTGVAHTRIAAPCLLQFISSTVPRSSSVAEARRQYL